MERAFNGAGFTVGCVEPTFDGQNLWLEARAGGDQQSPSVLPERPPNSLYSSFATRFAEKVAQWRQRIDEWRSERRKVVIWGAGSKGIMFLNLLGIPAGAGIDWVVDINPRKQGHFVPLMGQEIIGPGRLPQNQPDLVVVMNPEYKREVRSMLNDFGIDCEVVSG